MAYNPSEYPENVKIEGDLEQNEVFRYFKEALLYIPERYDRDLECWPVYDDAYLLSHVKIFNDGVYPSGVHADISMPITRAQFYSYIDKWSVNLLGDLANDGRYGGSGEYYVDYFSEFNGQKLYAIETPIGFSESALRAWGKIKSCELALFGSVGNGSDTSRTSIITTGTLRNSINNWKISDMKYLRSALIYAPFDESLPPPSLYLYNNPPTNLTINSGSRMFSWTYAPGITNPNRYLVSLRKGPFIIPSSNSMSFGDGHLEPRDIYIITRGSGYFDNSEPLVNTTFIKGVPIKLFVRARTVFGAPEPISVLADWSYLPYNGVDVTINGFVSYATEMGTEIEPFSMSLPKGAMSTSTTILALSQPTAFAQVLNVTASPSSVDDNIINVQLNTEPS